MSGSEVFRGSGFSIPYRRNLGWTSRVYDEYGLAHSLKGGVAVDPQLSLFPEINHETQLELSLPDPSRIAQVAPIDRSPIPQSLPAFVCPGYCPTCPRCREST